MKKGTWAFSLSSCGAAAVRGEPSAEAPPLRWRAPALRTRDRTAEDLAAAPPAQARCCQGLLLHADIHSNSPRGQSALVSCQLQCESRVSCCVGDCILSHWFLVQVQTGWDGDAASAFWDWHLYRHLRTWWAGRGCLHSGSSSWTACRASISISARTAVRRICTVSLGCVRHAPVQSRHRGAGQLSADAALLGNSCVNRSTG